MIREDKPNGGRAEALRYRNYGPTDRLRQGTVVKMAETTRRNHQPPTTNRERQIDAMQSISTSEFPGIPPAAAIVVRTGGAAPNRPRYASFMAA